MSRQCLFLALSFSNPATFLSPLPSCLIVVIRLSLSDMFFFFFWRLDQGSAVAVPIAATTGEGAGRRTSHTRTLGQGPRKGVRRRYFPLEPRHSVVTCTMTQDAEVHAVSGGQHAPAQPQGTRHMRSVHHATRVPILFSFYRNTHRFLIDRVCVMSKSNLSEIL